MEWLKKINNAIDYIENNLDSEISYDEAAQIACCSTYYFQRMFTYITGISLAEYIRRRRMTQAAFELQRTDKRVLLKEYGMQRVNGYIADMERCYQGNYYYIFPDISGDSDLMNGMSTQMVMMVNAQGMELTDPERDTITTTSFMTTSSNGYAVTEDSQEKGTYVLGAIAEETIEGEDVTDKNEEDSDTETETVKSRFTVITSESMLDSQITDSFSTLENLTLFANAVTANFDGVQNVAIEPKSLSITYNTMQHTGLIGFACIIGIPIIVLIYGFRQWLKRRKA